MHPLALPVHAPVTLCARLFRRAALVGDLADAFLFGGWVGRRALVAAGAFGQRAAGCRSQTQGHCAGAYSVQDVFAQELRVWAGRR